MSFFADPRIDARSAIVVLNWNGGEITLRCLASLTQAGATPDQVVVVDNGSTDGSAEVVAERFPGVALSRQARNLGFAGGINVGIRRALAAGAEYVLLLNNDTEVPLGFGERLLAPMLDEAEVGVCVPKILFPPPGRTVWAAGARWTRFPPRVKMIGYRRADRAEYSRPRYLSQATGCGLLVRAEVFARCGLFDQRYFLYYEDYDFCHRVARGGFRLAYAPEAELRHYVSQGLGENSAAKWRWLGRSSEIFYRQTVKCGWPAYSAYLLWVIAREVLKGNPGAVAPFLKGVMEQRDAGPGGEDESGGDV